MLSLDQEKAFVRVDWSFLRSTPYALGFGQSFIGWVNLFYNNSCSEVNVNGYISSFFFLSRGVRQGFPLSPLLYILVAEVLACNIRANSSISGLQLSHSPVTLSCVSAYADDTTLVVNLIHAIMVVFQVYSVYEEGSVAKLNLAKREGLRLGYWSGPSDSQVAIHGLRLKSKCWGFSLGRVIWRRRIGGPVSPRLKMLLIPGSSARCHIVARPLSSMPWPFLVCGTWPL